MTLTAFRNIQGETKLPYLGNTMDLRLRHNQEYISPYFWHKHFLMPNFHRILGLGEREKSCKILALFCEMLVCLLNWGNLYFKECIPHLKALSKMYKAPSGLWPLVTWSGLDFIDLMKFPVEMCPVPCIHYWCFDSEMSISVYGDL